jgi:GGDEF domain-containing protein
MSHRKYLCGLALQTTIARSARQALLVTFGWLLVSLAQAAPTLDLGGLDPSRLQIDLRAHWQTARLAAQDRAGTVPIDAQAVWSMPDSQFAAGQQAPVKLRAGERLVARLAVKVQASQNDLLVELPMPRLDIVHLSYRYDNDGAWVHRVAGDQIPMVDWPFANRHPVFVVQAKPGNLQIVLDVAHQGLVSTPVYLLGDAGFREARFDGALRTGALLGLAVVLSLVGFGAATVFKRYSFVVVALMTVSVGFAVFCQGGVAGMYMGTQTSWFNDICKFVSGMLCGALIPWTIAIVVSQKSYSKLVWWLVLLWMGGGLLATLSMTWQSSRDAQAATLPLYLVGSLVFALAIALGSVVRRQAHAHWTLAGVLFYWLGILAPLAAYWGYGDVAQSFVFSSVGFVLSTLLLLYTLVLQYRQGRLVTSRANTSPSRDVLTGLLSRQGFELMLAKNIRQLTTEKTYAAFFYIAVSDAKTLQERFGDEGFEVGMVQMAAAISSSVSVVDTVGRVAPNAFAVTVLMPRDAALANGLAQKFLTHTMALASHSAPLATTTRIAIAWLPVFGTLLPDIERRALSALRTLESGKRIVWVGGAYAQVDPSQLPGASGSPSTRPSAGQTADDNLPSLPGMINRLEHDMLGMDSEQLLAKGELRMRVMPVTKKNDAMGKSG